MYLRTKILIAFFRPASLLSDSEGCTCCYFQGLLPQSEGAHMCSLRAGSCPQTHRKKSRAPASADACNVIARA